jgi:4-aminobutyrate aminotransferase
MVDMDTHDIITRDNQLIADALKIRYTPFVAVRGEGAYLFDPEGRRYLDFSGGWAVAQLGYSDERVRQAVACQLAQTTFAGLISAINLPALDLAEKLVSLTPGDFPKKAWFGLSGSDASEMAQRMILRATGKRRLVSFVGSWHGTTDAAMGLSGHPSFAASPSGAHVTKAPYPNPYRNPFGFGDEDAGPQEIAERCLRFLEDYLFRTICPPEDVAAVFVEAVQSDAGDIVPPPNFLPGLRELCDRHGLLLVLDEVKTGLGRTGRMFAFEHAGITPDLVLLGKSLGGGLPLSAIVGRAEILDADSGIALFTVVGNATCCAAGLATIGAIEADGLVERAAEHGLYLQGKLRRTLAKYEIVGDIRGLGMIQGVELVSDWVTKEPNPAAAAKVVYRAWELGLILFYAGNWGNVLEITPPLILSREEIDEGVAILDQAIADVLAGRVSDEAVAAFAGW